MFGEEKEKYAMGNTTIQLRNDTAANWTSNDPTLAPGEMGLETDTNRIKFGDGSTTWNSLGYFSNSSFKYGLYTLSVNQTSNVAVNNHVEFNTSEGSLGGLATGSGQANGIVTLTAGKTYKIMFSLYATHASTAGYVAAQIYNRTGSAYIGKVVWCITVNAGAAQNPVPLGIAFITPSVNTDIDVRFSAVNTLNTIGNGETWLLIEEYGGY